MINIQVMSILEERFRFGTELKKKKKAACT